MNMKKGTLLLAILLCSCAQNRDNLYREHLQKLIDAEITENSKLPFDIKATCNIYENRYKVQVTFLNPTSDFNDITLMLLEESVKEAKENPLNLGYYNDEMINFVTTKEKDGDQNKIRFTFLSAKEKPTLKGLFTYQSDTRMEIFFNVNSYEEV